MHRPKSLIWVHNRNTSRFMIDRGIFIYTIPWTTFSFTHSKIQDEKNKKNLQERLKRIVKTEKKEC